MSVADQLISLPVRRFGSGHPLVLLHGGMGSWTHWTRNIPVLAEHYTVHAIDQPGCGDAPSVPPDISDEAYVGSVAQAVASADRGEGLYLAGFSFGGCMAALVAARLGNAVKRLALLAPGGFGNAHGRRMDVRKLPEGAGDAEMRSVLRHNLLAMMLAREDSLDDATVAIHYENTRRTRFDSRRFSTRPYLAGALARISCPVQLIFGTADHFAWPSVQARIELARGMYPGMRVDLIDGAGHWVQYEAADAVNRLLLEFFGASDR